MNVTFWLLLSLSLSLPFPTYLECHDGIWLRINLSIQEGHLMIGGWLCGYNLCNLSARRIIVVKQIQACTAIESFMLLHITMSCCKEFSSFAPKILQSQIPLNSHYPPIERI